MLALANGPKILITCHGKSAVDVTWLDEGVTSGLHLAFAQDVDYNVGAHFAPDKSCRLVHAHTVDFHAVDGDNHICTTSDAAVDTPHEALTVDSERATIGSPTTRINCMRVKPS